MNPHWEIKSFLYWIWCVHWSFLQSQRSQRSVHIWFNYLLSISWAELIVVWLLNSCQNLLSQLLWLVCIAFTPQIKGLTVAEPSWTFWAGLGLVVKSVPEINWHLSQWTPNKQWHHSFELNQPPLEASVSQGYCSDNWKLHWWKISVFSVIKVYQPISLQSVASCCLGMWSLQMIWCFKQQNDSTKLHDSFLRYCWAPLWPFLFCVTLTLASGY